MNKVVAETISRMSINPMEYIWFDMTDPNVLDRYSEWIDKHPQFAMSDPVEEIPLPFEKMGIIVPLDTSGITKNHFNETVPYPMTVTRDKDKLSIKTYFHGFQSHVNEMIYEKEIRNVRVKVDEEYRRRFGMIPEFFDEKNYKELIEIFWNYTAPLIYGSLNPGATITGYRPHNLVGNEKRRQNGRKQLFKWTTVEIKPKPPVERVDLGGTHASPRPHERRGHQRRLKSGKIINIKSMMINRHKIPTDGYIHHDYKVSA